MKNGQIKTQKDVRQLFWTCFPKADKRKIKDYSGKGRMYKTDTRVMFVEFVDNLHRNGEISDKLASRVTL